jgi:hypothetical protein
MKNKLLIASILFMASNFSHSVQAQIIKGPANTRITGPDGNVLPWGRSTIDYNNGSLTWRHFSKDAPNLEAEWWTIIFTGCTATSIEIHCPGSGSGTRDATGATFTLMKLKTRLYVKLISGKPNLVYNK